MPASLRAQNGPHQATYDRISSLLHTQSVRAVLICLATIAATHDGPLEAAHAHIVSVWYVLAKFDSSNQLQGRCIFPPYYPVSFVFLCYHFKIKCTIGQPSCLFLFLYLHHLRRSWVWMWSCQLAQIGPHQPYTRSQHSLHKRNQTVKCWYTSTYFSLYTATTMNGWP